VFAPEDQEHFPMETGCFQDSNVTNVLKVNFFHPAYFLQKALDACDYALLIQVAKSGLVQVGSLSLLKGALWDFAWLSIGILNLLGI
jgi:hypothetical protein